ncbi:MAG TPA: hypothetical protein VJR22_00335 [Candidatus Nitrosotalea sp.]|nr:hypothetical protein [Candidatus Nitrosotalea sp.]
MSLKIYLVRHPKGKDNDKKPEPNDNPAKDAPPVEPRPVDTDESRIKRGLDKVFWLRVGLGILAGTISAIFGSPLDTNERIFVGFGIMIVLFIVSYVIAKAFQVPLLPSDKRKLATTGYGSYFLMFIFSWILVNTIIHADVSSMIVH